MGSPLPTNKKRLRFVTFYTFGWWNAIHSKRRRLRREAYDDNNGDGDDDGDGNDEGDEGGDGDADHVEAARLFGSFEGCVADASSTLRRFHGSHHAGIYT